MTPATTGGNNGRLTGADNDHARVQFLYDDAGRLAGERQHHHASRDGHHGTHAIDEAPAWQWQHQQRHTATGAPQASRYGDLPELAWHTYGSGHLHGLHVPGLGLEIALEPDALHRETQRHLHLSPADGTGAAQPLILERGYTELGQLDHLRMRGPGSAQHEQHYRYDALGRMSFRSEHHQGQASPTIAYTYDPAGRLIASQHGDHAHRYPMDAAGNRLEAPPHTAPEANPSNRLAQLDGSRYRHDGAGNLIEREQQSGERLTLGYDGANRLVHLTHTSAYGHTRHAHYRYDALGRRISKSVRHSDGTTATTHYGWDGDRLVHEAQDHQRTTVVYEPGSFVPMLRIDETTNGQATTRQIGAYHTDALGTPMQLVTPKGETLWQAQPDDWAAIKHERGTTAQPIRFQGQWHDEESGLYYNRHRYYDPQQGRYISQDPIGLKGGTNLYGYVTNPTGMVDPLGLEGVLGSFRNLSRHDSELALRILRRTESDMKRANLIGMDNFFHCVAFCRVAKSDAPDKNFALHYGYFKEALDYARGRLGLYGDKERRSHQEMIEDNFSDLKVNSYGFSCPPDQSCSDRCDRYVPEDHLETRARLREMGYLD